MRLILRHRTSRAVLHWPGSPRSSCGQLNAVPTNETVPAQDCGLCRVGEGAAPRTRCLAYRAEKRMDGCSWLGVVGPYGRSGHLARALSHQERNQHRHDRCNGCNHRRNASDRRPTGIASGLSRKPLIHLAERDFFVAERNCSFRIVSNRYFFDIFGADNLNSLLVEHLARLMIYGHDPPFY